MHIAIIPARKGSKSIINKNLQKIGNRNLVERAVDSAQRAGIFKKIIISTDIPILKDLGDDKKVFIHERREELCTDSALMHGVVEDVLKHFTVPRSHIIWLLQPTSPFRQRVDFDRIARMFTQETSSVISVTSVEAYHPNRMYTIKSNLIYPIRFNSFKNKQALPKMYIRSGHFYVFYANDFLRKKEFQVSPCRPYIIPAERAVNVDSELDLNVARILFEKKVVK